MKLSVYENLGKTHHHKTRRYNEKTMQISIPPILKRTTNEVEWEVGEMIE